jgi:hypothetical protein
MMNATKKHDFATKFHITMPCLKVRCPRLPKPTLNFSQDTGDITTAQMRSLTFRSAYIYLFTSRIALGIDIFPHAEEEP